jgi:hypothetical protein
MFDLTPKRQLKREMSDPAEISINIAGEDVETRVMLANNHRMYSHGINDKLTDYIKDLLEDLSAAITDLTVTDGAFTLAGQHTHKNNPPFPILITQ